MQISHDRVTLAVIGGLLTVLAMTGCVAAPAKGSSGSTAAVGDATQSIPSSSVTSAAPEAAHSSSSSTPIQLGKPVSFGELGGIHPTTTQSEIQVENWRLNKSGSLPAACPSGMLQPEASQRAAPQSGSTWVAANTGATCTIRRNALVLSAAKTTIAKLQTSSSAGAQVLPRGGYARFQVTTNGPCAPTKQEDSARKPQLLQVLAASSGRVLGTVTAMSSACKGEAVRLTALPITEAVRATHAPASLTARLMTATLQQKARHITGTLFVTNATSKAFHTDTCPTVTATVSTTTVQALSRSTLACHGGFTVAPHSSAAIALAVPIGLSKQEFLLADVGGYLSLGLGDDASRSRSDA